jgi:hypothetical protein
MWLHLVLLPALKLGLEVSNLTSKRKQRGEGLHVKSTSMEASFPVAGGRGSRSSYIALRALSSRWDPLWVGYR